MHFVGFFIFHLKDILTPESNFSLMLPPIPHPMSHPHPPKASPRVHLFHLPQRQPHLFLPLILDAVSEGLPGAIFLTGQAEFTAGSVQHQGDNMTLGVEGQTEG